jgi:hypothetical protein
LAYRIEDGLDGFTDGWPKHLAHRPDDGIERLASCAEHRLGRLANCAEQGLGGLACLVQHGRGCVSHRAEYRVSRL